MYLGNLWRNKLIRYYDIYTEEEFENSEFVFSIEYDPKTKAKNIKKTFTHENFSQLFGGDETTALEHKNELFKLAAKSLSDRKKLTSDEKLKL